MPPRLPARSLSQAPSCQCFRTRPMLAVDANPCPPARSFHASSRDETRLRRDMWAWLNGPGKVFRQPLDGSTNYLGAYDKSGNLLRAGRRNQRRSEPAFDPTLNEDEEVIQEREEAMGMSPEEMDRTASDRARQRARRDRLQAEKDRAPPERPSDLRPYPANPNFRSQSVLSEPLREELYQQVVVSELDLNSVSAVYGVDVQRVAAVVRLKTIEKQWIEKGKPLAEAYHNGVMAMLPQTPFDGRPVPHESINDLPVHPWTRQQLFLPTSESRHFTREDAAKAFHQDLLPADDRIPNKHLIPIQKWENEGLDRQTRRQLIREMDAKDREEAAAKARAKADHEARTQVVVSGRRWNFKFTDVSVNAVGKDGRGREGVGLRYGVPHDDRKRGKFKLPTSVE